jgi:hypothetical protein
MPYHFEFDSDYRILVIVLEGHVRDQEMLQINREIEARISELSPSAGITDASAVTTFDVATHTIRELALHPSPYPPAIPRFLVAPTDYLFGMARMYQISGEREHVQVVRSREEALAALGVQKPKFEKLAK